MALVDRYATTVKMQCLRCSSAFESPAWFASEKAGKHKRKYCSLACAQAASRVQKVPTFECKRCGAVTERKFNIKASGYRCYNYSTKFCSSKCAGEATAELRHGSAGVAERGQYVMVRREGKMVPEHRAVMADVLGRPLYPNENVHHLNGQKSDNRPENLELWVVAQPHGQRVKDVVAYAIEILKQYPDELRDAGFEVVPANVDEVVVSKSESTPLLNKENGTSIEEHCQCR